MLRRLIDWNFALSNRIDRLLPYRFRSQLKPIHENLVVSLMNRRPDQAVLDVGGGHLCPFARRRSPGLNTTVYGTDILESQVRNNRDVDGGIVADAGRSLPFKDGAFDMVVTRTLIEHLPHNETFLAETGRVLKPGGYSVHVFPGKFAPFALLNVALPDAVARKLLFFFFPHWREEGGFKSFYHNCYYPRITNLLKQSGFEIAEIQLRYYQSIYFKPIFPIYLLSLLYDLTLWVFHVKPLSSELLVIGRKR